MDRSHNPNCAFCAFIHMVAIGLSQWPRLCVGIDTRSLAAFRIALGVILLYESLHWMWLIGAFTTDAGVQTRLAFMEVQSGGFMSPYWTSLHLANGSAWWQLALFGCGVLANCCLLVGYKTWTAAVVSSILIASTHARSPTCTFGADHLLRVVLFFSG